MASQTLTWSLAGVDPACNTAHAGANVVNGCGIHIHAGTSCESAADVGGHYYNSELSEDPWKDTVYVATEEGFSSESRGVEVVSGLTAQHVTGHVLVVHELASGGRIACGVIGVETGPGSPLFVSGFTKYPGYTGDLQVAGTVGILGVSGTDRTASQKMAWHLTGLDLACNSHIQVASVPNGCGIHVHVGTSCEEAALVGGHFWSAALDEDPWKTIGYVVSAGGTSHIEIENAVEVVTGLSNANIQERVLVVHSHSGARVACAVIALASEN